MIVSSASHLKCKTQERKSSPKKKFSAGVRERQSGVENSGGVENIP